MNSLQITVGKNNVSFYFEFFFVSNQNKHFDLTEKIQPFGLKFFLVKNETFWEHFLSLWNFLLDANESAHCELLQRLRYIRAHNFGIAT